jgi:hypothetical protein
MMPWLKTSHDFHLCENGIKNGWRELAQGIFFFNIETLEWNKTPLFGSDSQGIMYKV